MDLNELQQQWQRLDQKLDQTLRLNSELLRQSIVLPARRRIHMLSAWPAIDVTACSIVLLVVGAFTFEHVYAWSLVVPAIIVMVGAVVLLCDSVRQLIRVAGIDWFGPVAEIQSELSRLRVGKITQFKWVILCSPLVGLSGLIVGMQFLLDRFSESTLVLDELDPWWVFSNFVFGVLFIPFGQILIRFVANRFGGHGWWQQLSDGISGTSLKKAQRELERWTDLSGPAAS